MQKARPTLPTGFSKFVGELLTDISTVDGYLSPNEIRFLALLAACPTAKGEVLEIGSFKGKSTIILARSAALAGDGRVNAVDPMTAPSETDPDLPDGGSSLPDFRANVERFGVDGQIVLHQMLSQDLAARWEAPIRLLWIDGDHTYQGTKLDFESFSPFIADKGIVAIHDVLHEFEGGIRVFIENILLSPNFGSCGFCGSIAWTQFHADPAGTCKYERQKLSLYKKLSRLIPYVALGRRLDGMAKKRYKILRSFIPKSAVEPKRWLNMLD